MASKFLTIGVPSALAVGGALTASTLLTSTSNDNKTESSPAPGAKVSQGSVFDFNANFLGQTLSYKKNQVVATVKEVGKEIKETGVKVAEGSK